MIKIIFFLLLSFNLYGESFNDEFTISSDWNSADHPNIFFTQYESNLSKLKLKNKLESENIPWSDSYWPKYLGGVSYRWQDDILITKKDLLPLSKLKKMGQEELDRLSPAEKWDILNGDYRYKYTKSIFRANPHNSEKWKGICHGWAEAAIKHKQLNPKTLVNKDQISIHWGYSDLNAILSQYYAYEARGKVYILGKRCRRDKEFYACDGINPGALHIILTNSLEQKKSFVLDLSRGSEVWNHPVVGYEYKLGQKRNPSPQSGKNTVSEVYVELLLSYVSEGETSLVKTNSVVKRVPYSYWLELDKDGKITGGEWVSTKRPDFAWYRKYSPLPSKYEFLN